MSLHENLQDWLNLFRVAIPKESAIAQYEVMQEMIDTKNQQIDKMCKMLDGVTTQVSKTSTVHALSCITIDEFLEKEFEFFTKK